jgi:NAD(P)-dependent dehydrogenase (short-subunit alcohol dehydrogenase family)
MKTALVTGASSGIGEATAQRLVMAGYKVYGTSRRAAKASQRSFELLPLDVTSDESVEATVSELLRVEGRIDIARPAQPTPLHPQHGAHHHG